mmetsp:Transcript_61877/g.174898  ORF Transcript_61877/g.174898 Transcript_61877/m.174898 type:complete len:450 (+) Transcript_61877:256-1605(+)
MTLFGSTWHEEKHTFALTAAPAASFSSRPLEALEPILDVVQAIFKRRMLHLLLLPLTGHLRMRSLHIFDLAVVLIEGVADGLLDVPEPLLDVGLVLVVLVLLALHVASMLQPILLLLGQLAVQVLQLGLLRSGYGRVLVRGVAERPLEVVQALFRRGMLRLLVLAAASLRGMGGLERGDRSCVLLRGVAHGPLDVAHSLLQGRMCFRDALQMVGHGPVVLGVPLAVGGQLAVGGLQHLQLLEMLLHGVAQNLLEVGDPLILCGVVARECGEVLRGGAVRILEFLEGTSMDTSQLVQPAVQCHELTLVPLRAIPDGLLNERQAFRHRRVRLHATRKLPHGSLHVIQLPHVLVRRVSQRVLKHLQALLHGRMGLLDGALSSVGLPHVLLGGSLQVLQLPHVLLRGVADRPLEIGGALTHGRMLQAVVRTQLFQLRMTGLTTGEAAVELFEF